MKIVSYNVNGLRAAMGKGLLNWIKKGNFDILCFQETKSQPGQIDTRVFEEMGYSCFWHSAEKKGYSGVLTLSKEAVVSHQIGMGIQRYDDEGRTVITHHRDFSLINVYIPSGSSGEDRHAFKMEFLNDFDNWVGKFQKQSGPLIVVGDYNIVHRGMDIHNPDRKDNPSGYRPEERAWMDQWFEKLGFIDAYRHCNPKAGEYSWWSYRAGSRQKNKGWRIDYIAVSRDISGHLSGSIMDKSAVHSDHCPVIAEFNFY